jgi:hypothetical protein
MENNERPNVLPIGVVAQEEEIKESKNWNVPESPVSDNTSSVEDSATKGYIEMTREVIEKEKDKQQQEQIAEIKSEIPKALDAKAKEIPEGEEIAYLVENGILPPSALEKKESKTEVDETQSSEDSDDEEESENFSMAPEVEYDAEEEWETGIGENLSDNQQEDVSEEYEIVSATNTETIFRTYIHERPVLTKIENKKLEAMTDTKAFEAFLLEQRKKYREKLSMPLVNSGIIVDFIGAGAFDYSDIYSQDPEHGTLTTDTLNRMKVMMKNIVEVSPKMNPKKLLSSISYTDYQLASLGFAAATIPEIDVPGTCEKCSAPFIIRTKTVDTVLNADKINERWITINNTPESERVFKKTAEVEYFDGYIKFKIEMPNFQKVKDGFAEIEQAIKNKTADIGLRHMASVFINIESITIDNVIVTDVVNAYKVIKTMTDEEIKVIRDAINMIYADVIVPEFGVSANCPKCSHNNVIQIGSVEDMVFFHLWVRKMLETVKLQKKNMTNG